MKNIVIFGATSAIAISCARLWSKQGNCLFLVGRDQKRLELIKADLIVRSDGQLIETYCADLNDLDKHKTIIDEANKVMTGIDIFLVAHGSLPDQKVCEKNPAVMLEEVKTNAISAISLLSVAADLLESFGSGTIAAIGSVAGDRGRQSNYIYGASKAMLATFMQGLRNRMYKKGIAVVTIKPGFVDTPMTADFDKNPLWAQPDDVAKGIVSAIDKGRNCIYLPRFWFLIMSVIRSIPEGLFKKLPL